ncbi:GNAT family N-acetyltransferase [Brevibacillus reuszeri]|uniref:GNAT family N-acetyltransferase n=1 Tax=Brevibacillus reuszeri TaxID=54915 RepID=UPI00366F5595
MTLLSTLSPKHSGDKGMEYNLFTLKEHPEMASDFDAMNEAGWPTFMLYDEVAIQYYSQVVEIFPQFQFCIADESGTVMACCNSVPFYWDGTEEGLPAGWDHVFIKSIEDYHQGRVPNTVSALAIVIHPSYRGKGISGIMLDALKGIVKSHSIEQLVAPVRPSSKSKYPLIPMDKYVHWQNDKGDSFDPWIRTHLRAGAKIVKLAPESMKINGTVADWESWTNMKFPESGTYIVPGALVPVTIDVEKNEGRYVEPNVWIQHFI